jgi:hypothetical protein
MPAPHPVQLRRKEPIMQIGLKQRPGLVGEMQQPGLEVKVPDHDSSRGLVEYARTGFAAIETLYLERNAAIERAEKAHAHNIYLINICKQLRAELNKARQERDYVIRSHARVQAFVMQMHDLIGRSLAEIAETATVRPNKTTAAIDDARPASSLEEAEATTQLADG